MEVNRGRITCKVKNLPECSGSKESGQMMQHMIGDVVPLVTQPMIDYLTSKTK
jgi:hypothetical protein